MANVLILNKVLYQNTTTTKSYVPRHSRTQVGSRTVVMVVWVVHDSSKLEYHLIYYQMNHHEIQFVSHSKEQRKLWGSTDALFSGIILLHFLTGLFFYYNQIPAKI